MELCLFLVGLAFKISAVPFHMWAPDVYEGSPTSVTLFFAVVPKIAALTVFIRFLYVPFINMIDQWQIIIVFLINCFNDFWCCRCYWAKEFKKISCL